MWSVSTAFKRVLSGSHQATFEALLVVDYQTGPTPTGIELPIFNGDVTLDASAEVRGTLSLTTSGLDSSWRRMFPRGKDRRLAPYGSEIFVRRGIDMGGNGTEWVPLGYYRIDDTQQEYAADGPIRLTGSDRMATIVDSEFLRPRQFEQGTTIGTIFTELVTEVYPLASIAIDDPTAFDLPINRQLVYERDRYEALWELANSLGKIMYWDGAGVLRVVDPPNINVLAWEITSRRNGVLVEPSRNLSRSGVINAMVVRGEAQDDEDPIQAIVTINNPEHPLVFGGRFGRIPDFYQSPLITTGAQAHRIATNMLNDQSGQQYSVDFGSVVNPALEPHDPVRIRFNSSEREVHTIERITIPLVADDTMRGTTKDATYRRDPLPPPPPPCLPPFWVNSSHAYSNVAVEPVGVMPGDVLIAIAGNDGAHLAAPSGGEWTQIGSDLDGGSFDTHARVWLHERGASPPNYVWQTGAPDFAFAHVGAWRNMDPSPVDADTGTPETLFAPSVTTTEPNQLLICLYADSSFSATATPTDMEDRSARPYVAHTSLLADQVIGIAGATGDREFFGADPVGGWSFVFTSNCSVVPPPVSGIPDFVNSWGETNTNVGELPVGTLEGDVLLAITTNDGSALSGPTGWTQVGSTRNGGSFDTYSNVWTIQVGGSPPDLTWTGSLDFPSVHIIAYRNANPTIVDIATSSAGSDTALSVTATADPQLLVCLATDSFWSAVAVPPGMNDRTPPDSGGAALIGDEAVAAGATGTRTFNLLDPVAAWSVILERL